jgi:hypothetical protein
MPFTPLVVRFLNRLGFDVIPSEGTFNLDSLSQSVARSECTFSSGWSRERPTPYFDHHRESKPTTHGHQDIYAVTL